MNILFDTCVVIDALQAREPFAPAAQELLIAVANTQIQGFITAKALTDIHYLTHRCTHDESKARVILGKLLTLFDVLDTTANDCRNALASEMSDYEEAVTVETASRSGMDYIVTRNERDYRKSRTPVLSPSQLIEMLKYSE